jgi:hypothetical protein
MTTNRIKGQLEKLRANLETVQRARAQRWIQEHEVGVWGLLMSSLLEYHGHAEALERFYAVTGAVDLDDFAAVRKAGWDSLEPYPEAWWDCVFGLEILHRPNVNDPERQALFAALLAMEQAKVDAEMGD